MWHDLGILPLCCISQGVDSMSRYEQALRQVRYRNSRPAALTDRKFRITCSELNGRYTSNEFILEVSLKAPHYRPPHRWSPAVLSGPWGCALRPCRSAFFTTRHPRNMPITWRRSLNTWDPSITPSWYTPWTRTCQVSRTHTRSWSTFMFNRGQTAASLANVFCLSAVPSQQILLAGLHRSGETLISSPQLARTSKPLQTIKQT